MTKKVRLGFTYTNDLRTRGIYHVDVVDEKDTTLLSAISRETTDDACTSHNNAIDAAIAAGKGLDLPVNLGNFEKYDDRFGYISTARVSTRESSDWGATIGVIALLLFAVLGTAWLILNMINGTSTLL